MLTFANAIFQCFEIIALPGCGIVAAILFMVICTLIGALGLTNLANTGLTIVSYIGMPLVVIPLFFIWPQRTRKFRQAEREQAAAEQKS